MGNPPAGYPSSLREVCGYDVELVLPAHGNELTGFHERIDELLHPHEERFEEVRATLRDGAKTAYEVAGGMRRHVEGRWEELPTCQRHMAATEAPAHLEPLHSRGEPARRSAGGLVRYRPAV